VVDLAHMRLGRHNCLLSPDSLALRLMARRVVLRAANSHQSIRFNNSLRALHSTRGYRISGSFARNGQLGRNMIELDGHRSSFHTASVHPNLSPGPRPPPQALFPGSIEASPAPALPANGYRVRRFPPASNGSERQTPAKVLVSPNTDQTSR